MRGAYDSGRKWVFENQALKNIQPVEQVSAKRSRSVGRGILQQHVDEYKTKGYAKTLVIALDLIARATKAAGLGHISIHAFRHK